MLQYIVEVVIQESIRAIGVTVLKIVTLGRYRSRGAQDLLLEGGVGVLTLIAIGWVVYVAWPR
jgi:hypothetical protein